MIDLMIEGITGEISTKMGVPSQFVTTLLNCVCKLHHLSLSVVVNEIDYCKVGTIKRIIVQILIVKYNILLVY